MQHIQLEVYEGPLDLLLKLIEKHEIDIHDIPIAKLTGQYLAEIQGMPADMDGMSEFLVMAATLLEIKSRMLLPRPVKDEEEQGDPREALVQKLIAYKYCQALAESLRELETTGQRLFREPEYSLVKMPTIRRPEEYLEAVTADMLQEIFADVMRRQALKVDTVRQNFGEVPREQHTITDKMERIKTYLRDKGSFRLSQLFFECRTRQECIVTFLALLEMVKIRKISARQTEVFGEVEVMEWHGL